MSPRPDYYELLDVEPSVPQAELKQAYYRQARKFHPDVNSGDAAAEERFKLIAEAYRVLGNETERRLYDEARERDLRYADAPELASMQRVARFSVRRRAGRHERATAPRRRFTILPRRKGLHPLVIWLMGLFWVSALAPFVLRTGGRAFGPPPSAPKKEKAEPAADVVRERLARMRADLEHAAASGDARAQLRMGLLLYSGDAGAQMDRAAAREWWQKAADQGNRAAAYYLEKGDFSTPPAEPVVEETSAGVEDE